jgi:hypothetical protein
MNNYIRRQSGDTSMLDLTSFSLGFLVAPVAYVIVGAVAYSSFCAGKRLAAILRVQRSFDFRNGADCPAQ